MTPSEMWTHFAASALTATGGNAREAAVIADFLLEEFENRYEWEGLEGYWERREVKE